MANKRKRYNKGKRVDMRQGGRVALAKGNLPEAEEGIFGNLKNTVQTLKKEKPPMTYSTPVDLTDPRPIPTSDDAPRGGKVVGGPRTPEELKQQEQLGYVAGRTPTTSIPQVQAGNIFPKVQQDLREKVQEQIQTDREDTMTDAQREAAERALQAAQGRGPGGQGGPWWRRAGFNSRQEALTAGYDPDTGQQTATATATETTTGARPGTESPTYANLTEEQQQAARQRVQDAAEGVVPEAAIIPEAVQVDTGVYTEEQLRPWQKGGIGGTVLKNDAGYTAKQIAEGMTTDDPAFANYTMSDVVKLMQEELKLIGQPDPNSPMAADTIKMEDVADVKAETIEMPSQEQVATGVSTKARQQQVGDAAQMEAAQVTEAPVIDAQTGQVSPEAIAEMQNATLTMAAEGVTVDQTQASQALAENVVGTLSPEAKAEAAKVAGTDLPRVLRAKKQLRRSGLTEEQINLIGNDPEALEDELMDYTEEQRGMIAGLPEEALVSTQLNALLEGVENGEIPAFARPAMAAVEQMLAQRGMSASTVGRDALINAMIQSAIPLAQSNAQSIKESVMQQRTIEAQAEQVNAQMRQQTALANADKVFNMDMANFTAEQQTALGNSKFLQTVALTDTSNEQNAVLTNAANMAKLDLAELDANTRLQAQNAQTFLQMDMANLNNRQQAEIISAQQEQQRLLSNQAAENAARNANMASQNQRDQFVASLAQQVEMNNAARNDAMSTFNASQANAAEARRVGIEADINKANAAMVNDINKMNAQMDFNRQQWNAANAQAVEMSNVEWRRKANLANTAAQNEVNARNAQNAFGLSSQAMSFMWQELRDQAEFDFKWADNEATRKTQLLATAIANEGEAASKWSTNLTSITNIIDRVFGG